MLFVLSQVATSLRFGFLSSVYIVSIRGHLAPGESFLLAGLGAEHMDQASPAQDPSEPGA